MKIITCCFIPEDQQHLIPKRKDQPLPEGVGCSVPAQWQIWFGETSDDNTLACTAHVGELLDPVRENRVYLYES